MKKYAVTVDLPDRYWFVRIYVEEMTVDEAKSAVEQKITELRQYVPDANFQVSDVEPIIN